MNLRGGEGRNTHMYMYTHQKISAIKMFAAHTCIGNLNRQIIHKLVNSQDQTIMNTCILSRYTYMYRMENKIFKNLPHELLSPGFHIFDRTKVQLAE